MYGMFAKSVMTECQTVMTNVGVHWWLTGVITMPFVAGNTVSIKAPYCQSLQNDRDFFSTWYLVPLKYTITTEDQYTEVSIFLQSHARYLYHSSWHTILIQWKYHNIYQGNHTGIFLKALQTIITVHDLRYNIRQFCQTNFIIIRYKLYYKVFFLCIHLWLYQLPV